MTFQNSLNKAYATRVGTMQPANSNLSDVRIAGRVLLVEDDEANSLVASTLLEMHGYKVDHVDNGHAALEKIKTAHYSLVLMDLRMPKIDGIKATMLIRQYEEQSNLKPTKIICVTACGLSEERAKCFAVGMNGYLLKPYNPAAFLTMIHAAMDSAA